MVVKKEIHRVIINFSKEEVSEIDNINTFTTRTAFIRNAIRFYIDSLNNPDRNQQLSFQDSEFKMRMEEDRIKQEKNNKLILKRLEVIHDIQVQLKANEKVIETPIFQDQRKQVIKLLKTNSKGVKPLKIAERLNIPIERIMEIIKDLEIFTISLNGGIILNE